MFRAFTLTAALALKSTFWIAQHMTPLLYLLMMRLQDIVRRITKHKPVEDADLIALEELATSCIAVFAAFEDRMHDLLRGWRFEGKDIHMQVDRYADGLFRKCYREVRWAAPGNHGTR